MTNEALTALASAFSHKIASRIMADEAYIEMMMEVLPEMVSDEVGISDINDITELSMAIMDNLTLAVA